jgi:hypothetical protein
MQLNPPTWPCVARWAADVANGFVRSEAANTSVISWGATGTTTPGSYTAVTEEFTLTPAIAPTSARPVLTGGAAVSGLATFSVVYL